MLLNECISEQFTVLMISFHLVFSRSTSSYLLIQDKRIKKYIMLIDFICKT